MFKAFLFDGNQLPEHAVIEKLFYAKMLVDASMVHKIAQVIAQAD